MNGHCFSTTWVKWHPLERASGQEHHCTPDLCPLLVTASAWTTSDTEFILWKGCIFHMYANPRGVREVSYLRLSICIGIAKHTTALCHTFPSSEELEGHPEKARSLNFPPFTFHSRGSLEELLSAL